MLTFVTGCLYQFFTQTGRSPYLRILCRPYQQTSLSSARHWASCINLRSWPPALPAPREEALSSSSLGSDLLKLANLMVSRWPSQTSSSQIRLAVSRCFRGCSRFDSRYWWILWRTISVRTREGWMIFRFFGRISSTSPSCKSLTRRKYFFAVFGDMLSSRATFL